MASDMIYNAEKGDISIAVAGDAMITRRMKAFTEPAFLDLVDILRKTDVSIVNLEMLFHDYESTRRLLQKNNKNRRYELW